MMCRKGTRTTELPCFVFSSSNASTLEAEMSPPKKKEDHIHGKFIGTKKTWGSQLAWFIIHGFSIHQSKIIRLTYSLYIYIHIYIYISLSLSLSLSIFISIYMFLYTHISIYSTYRDRYSQCRKMCEFWLVLWFPSTSFLGSPSC